MSKKVKKHSHKPQPQKENRLKQLFISPIFRQDLIGFIVSLLLSYGSAFLLENGSLKRLLMLLFGISAMFFASSIAKKLSMIE